MRRWRKHQASIYLVANANVRLNTQQIVITIIITLSFVTLLVRSSQKSEAMLVDYLISFFSSGSTSLWMQHFTSDYVFFSPWLAVQ